ncbi:MAG TPA: serine/threonine-protein kinase, partial [Candidatus Acidoferrum sp.]|nr:serine/threonine-protein kinase [Candidatus Acidoferrum sp.]
MATWREPQFFGSERFEVVRPLGAGGMGIVYQVYDRERARTVALKTLHQREAWALYRLKREFRALADISHPNLARLYELVSSEGEWFFTMELVDGVDFITWVRGASAEAEPEAVRDTDMTATRPDRPGPGLALVHRRSDSPTLPSRQASAPPPEPSRPESYDRLRDALRQLAEGVQALHEAGKLHRDIKPSNVIVDGSGRVVLLDFGLITDVARPDGETSKGYFLAGTVDYMSPEQAASGPVGPASDWYSVGTVLYHSLTGTLPFHGPPLTVLAEKQSRQPEPPEHLVSETPADLSELCGELLRLDPGARPAGNEILERLDRRVPHPPARRPRDSRPLDVPLIGRGVHAAALRDAFDAAIREERAVTVLVHGRSGMGKSILIERVTRSLAREQG